MKYGYLPAPDPSTGQLQAWTSVTSAVKAMQRFAGLKDTGVLGECSVPSSSLSLQSLHSSVRLGFFCRADEETLVLMKSPRCSLPDQDQASASASNPERGSSRRRRRAVAMWTRRNINWRLEVQTQHCSGGKKPNKFSDTFCICVHFVRMTLGISLRSPSAVPLSAVTAITGIESNFRRLSVNFCPLLYTSVLLYSDRCTQARGLQ